VATGFKNIIPMLGRYSIANTKVEFDFSDQFIDNWPKGSILWKGMGLRLPSLKSSV